LTSSVKQKGNLCVELRQRSVIQDIITVQQCKRLENMIMFSLKNYRVTGLKDVWIMKWSESAVKIRQRQQGRRVDDMSTDLRSVVFK